MYVPVDRKEEGKFVKCSLRIKSARPEFLISRHVAQVRQRGAGQGGSFGAVRPLLKNVRGRILMGMRVTQQNAN